MFSRKGKDVIPVAEILRRVESAAGSEDRTAAAMDAVGSGGMQRIAELISLRLLTGIVDRTGDGSVRNLVVTGLTIEGKRGLAASFPELAQSLGLFPGENSSGGSNYYFGSVDNSTIAAGASLAINMSNSLESNTSLIPLGAAVETALAELDGTPLGDEQREFVRAELETVRSQCASPMPRKEYIHQSLRSVMPVLDRFVGSSAFANLSELARKLLTE